MSKFDLPPGIEVPEVAAYKKSKENLPVLWSDSLIRVIAAADAMRDELLARNRVTQHKLDIMAEQWKQAEAALAEARADIIIRDEAVQELCDAADVSDLGELEAALAEALNENVRLIEELKHGEDWQVAWEGGFFERELAKWKAAHPDTEDGT